jgi:phosphate starvation-inducible protein PhoH and related proteins
MTAMAKPKPKRQYQPALSIVPDTHPQHTPAPSALRAQTESQRVLMSSLRSNTLSIVSGPAGTGKTYVSLAIAAQMLQERRIDRLVITRPMIGCDDDDIGILPGTVLEKVSPWCLPMLDVLEDRLGASFVQYLIGADRIRISPLALMRGSSFSRTFLFVTEAQNATPKQVKMLLTRVGEGTTVVLEGDLAQTDLRQANGLQDAITRLTDLDGVGVVEFTREDVVRSAFCRSVLDRYE